MYNTTEDPTAKEDKGKAIHRSQNPNEDSVKNDSDSKPEAQIEVDQIRPQKFDN